jgi:beta-lactam-binding protein with PASTA domain
MRKSKNSALSSVLRVMFIFTVSVFILIAVFLLVLRFAIKGRSAEVPDIVGKSFLEATQILNKSHLGTPVIDGEKYNVSMPEGYIVEQKPKPGSRVKTGREIKVFISKGTEAGVVPNVTGETIAEAQPILQSLGLEMGAITRVRSDDYPKEGIIIAHTPPSHAMVQKGVKINLLVSMGRPFVQLTMPDLSGMYQEDALELIKVRGLRQGLISREISPEVNEAGIVLDQYPQPNDHIKKGAAVNITVSSTGE